MPKFNLATIERWEHRVTYNNVEAATLEEALKLIKSGDLAYDDQEVIECGDDVQCIVFASMDGQDLTVPPELGMESIDAPSPSLFTPSELATVLAALRYWQHDLDHIDDALVLDVADCFADHTPLTPAEIDALCERLNLPDRIAVSSEGGCDCGENCNRGPGEACPNDNAE